MSIGYLHGNKSLRAPKYDNLTPIREPSVWKMWDPRRLITVWAFTAYYSDKYIFYFIIEIADHSVRAV
jgi:hypothetical protein